MNPRLLTKDQAAQYCSLSKGGFDHWVSTGKVPGPIPQSHRWDRKALDLALDRLSKIEKESPQSALDRWREESGFGSET